MKNLRDVLLIFLIVILIIIIVTHWGEIKTDGFFNFIKNVIYNQIIFILSTIIIALSILIRLREYSHKNKK
mgnify:CR=1 FL=1